MLLVGYCYGLRSEVRAKFILRNQKDPRMRRHNFKAAADDNSLPVMVPSSLSDSGFRLTS